MKRLVIICVCVLGMCHFLACKKSNIPAVTAAATAIFPGDTQVPYDTSGVSGVFLSRLSLDSSGVTAQCNLSFSAWFTHRVTKGFADSAIVIANGRTLTEQGNYLTANTGSFIPPTGFKADTPVAWIVKGNAQGSFGYANTDSFPAYTAALPDTVSATLNNTFVFNTSTVADADTILFQLVMPVNKDSSVTVLSYYGNPSGGNITLEKGITGMLAKKSIGVFVSVFNHQVLTINGSKHMFIKQYTLGRNVWFK